MLLKQARSTVLHSTGCCVCVCRWAYVVVCLVLPLLLFAEVSCAPVKQGACHIRAGVLGCVALQAWQVAVSVGLKS